MHLQNPNTIDTDYMEIIMKKTTNADKTKIHLLSKMSTKITGLVLAAILVPVIVLITLSEQNMTKTMKNIYMSYAQNLAEEAVSGIDFAVELGESTYGNYAMDMAKSLVRGIETQGDQAVSSVLTGVTIEGVEGSYAYMVDASGIMLYHPTAEKIGSSVENAAVKGIVAELASGKTVEDGFTIYEYKGAMKLAGYALTKSNDIVIVTADYDAFMRVDYDTLIGEIEIKGVAGSYAYLVSPDGTMLYHKNPEKIGQPVENAAVKGIVADLEVGKTVENSAVVYEYKGEDKLAGYAFTSNGNIVVVTADYKTFIQPINQMKSYMVMVSAVLAILFGVAGTIFVMKLMKAFENLIPGIQKTASLDFREDINTEKLALRKDEIGLIAREMMVMEENLGTIVGNIKDVSDSIDANVINLNDISARVSDMCSENSSTSETLAAGMEETSASTTLISENILEMKQGAKDIEQMTLEGAEKSMEIMERATKLRESTEQATKNTMDMYTSVKEKSAVAGIAVNAVQKINALTDTVMEISSQTGLLALNASIEAARAGEAGKGFAVVAGEISNLSVQTTNAVTNINKIVNEVNEAVHNLADCLTDTVDFLEDSVIKDYENFESVSEQYQNDANNFKASMDEVKTGIVGLNNTMESITDSIGAISNTMNDAAGGVTDIAGKTVQMEEETRNTTLSVEECRKCVEDLSKIVEHFVLG